MDQDLFSVCWDDYKENLTGSLQEQMLKNQFCDVTFLTADGETFNAHKNILAASSPYFHMIFSQMPESKQGFIFLKGVSSVVLDNLMKFLYCGEVEIAFEDLPELIALSKELQIKGLIKKSPKSEVATPSTKEAPVTSTPVSTGQITSLNSRSSTDGSASKKKVVNPFRCPLTATPKSADTPKPVRSRIKPVKPKIEKSPVVLLERVGEQSFKRQAAVPQRSSKRQKMSSDSEKEAAEDSETEQETIEQNDVKDETMSETTNGEKLQEESNVTENGQNQNESTSSAAAESSALMCFMSNHGNQMLVIDDFVYKYVSRDNIWPCRKCASSKCKRRLHLVNGVPKFSGEHNHPPETESIDSNKLIPFDPSLLNTSSTTKS